MAVARALAREPKVLLLDEPFSAVDKATRQKLYRELAAMRQRLSMPVLLVTHDLDEALMLGDRLSLLHHGRTLQDGPPILVMQRPATVEAARLVGHRNLFEATVLEHQAPPGFTAAALVRARSRGRTQPHLSSRRCGQLDDPVIASGPAPAGSAVAR